MTALYKYTSHISFFDNRKVKFSPVKDFNDPYEINPNKDPKKISGIAKIAYETYSALKTRETCKDLISNDRILEIEQNFFQSKRSSQIEKIYNENLEKLKKEVFIFCLSKNPVNPLMWAHYADKHKGFCIGFDGSHDFFAENSFEVEYSNHRFTPTSIDPESLMGILYRKSLDWSYEHEVRVIKTKKQINLDENPKLLLEVPKDAIKEIFVGISSQIELKQKCLEFSKKIGIPCYQIVESIDSFEFERKLIFTPEPA